MRQRDTTSTGSLAYDDTGGDGPLVVLLPGAGDLRSEHRLLAPRLEEAGYRVVTVDLPGHGDSPAAASYGVAETASALTELITSLDAGPAVVVGCSFSPAAAVWAAVDDPGTIERLVLISPHLEADDSLNGRLQRLATTALLRGPWAGSLWTGLYRGWYKGRVPDDMGAELTKLRAMLGDPAGKRAVRETLTATRDGMHQRIDSLDLPSLVVFGSEDDHFSDPTAECRFLADRLGGEGVVVDGAGHYPHVERPDLVAEAIVGFLGGT